MRSNPDFEMDPRDVRRTVRENPWALLVSATSGGLVASHYPVLLEEDREELSILTHVGRPDELVHELGAGRELLVVVQGPQGYLSPSWYGTPDEGPAVPTWNFTALHLTGVPEVLDAEANLRALAALADHLESPVDRPRAMLADPRDAEYAHRIAGGTVGLRLNPTRVEAKAKLSQDKPAAVVDRVLRELEGPGPYAAPALAAEMRRVRDGDRG